MPSTGNPPLRVADLGRQPYLETWELQKDLVDRRADGTIPDTLLLVEHDPVITLGRRTDPAELLNAAGSGVPILEIERGGQATYHAPGQLVGYPILRLEEGDRDLHKLLRNLEETLIRALVPWGLIGSRRSQATGVWVGNRKIASIGVAVRRWTSYHGFALNVNTDLAGFSAIRPCGLEASVMTSMAQELGHPIEAGEVREQVVAAFAEVFDRVPGWIEAARVKS